MKTVNFIETTKLEIADILVLRFLLFLALPIDIKLRF